jgi:hypothetical protein
MTDKNQFVVEASTAILASMASSFGQRPPQDGDKAAANLACNLAEALYDVLKAREHITDGKTYLTR